MAGSTSGLDDHEIVIRFVQCLLPSHPLECRNPLHNSRPFIRFFGSHKMTSLKYVLRLYLCGDFILRTVNKRVCSSYGFTTCNPMMVPSHVFLCKRDFLGTDALFDLFDG